MRRMIFQANEELLGRLKRRARERGLSEAQVIREALERELDDATQPPLTCIGVAEGSGENLAERIDELYEPDPWRS